MPDLTTLANVCQVLNLDPATIDANSSALISRMVSAYSQWFLSQVNRGSFLTSTYVETRDGRRSGVIVTQNYPVTAVASVGYSNGLALTQSTMGAYGWLFDQFGILMPGGFLPGHQNVIINYTAGYATTPFDVEEAIINQIVFMKKRMQSVDVTSNTAEGQLTLSYNTKELAPGVQSVIDSYKNEAVLYS
jgi:hypothetical protein